MHQISTEQPINNVAVYPNIYPMSIFQNATATDPGQSLSYTLPVEPNLEYSVWIYLAELAEEYVGPTSRVFDIVINDVKVWQSVDVVAWARGPLNALILNHSMVVEGRTLTVTFNPIRGNVAVNAFEVYALIPTEKATLNSNGKVWDFFEGHDLV